MKNKKGFTLVEIIVCICLIGIIATISIISINKKNTYSNITKKILEAVNVYIATEKDNKGNTYEYGINNGGKGVKINVNELVNKGYIDNNTFKTLQNNYKLDSNKNYLVWVTNSIKNKDDTECGTGALEYTVNWENTDKIIYLCPYTSTENNTNDNTLLGKILKDFNDNGSTCNNEGIDTGICLLRGNNVTKDGKSVYYYAGSNQKNYIKLDDKLFYIVRTMEDGGVKLVSAKKLDSSDTLNTGETASDTDIQHQITIKNSMFNYDDILIYYFGFKSAYKSPYFCKIDRTSRRCTIKTTDSNNTNWSDDNKFDVEYYVSSSNSITIEVSTLPYMIYESVNKWYNELSDKIKNNVLESEWCDSSYSIGVKNGKRTRYTKCKNDTLKYKFGLLNFDEYYLITTSDSVDTVNSPYNDSGGRNNIKIYDEKMTYEHTFDFGVTTHLLFFLHDNTLSRISGVLSDEKIYIRPAIVVKDDLVITDGDGTKNNPYIAKLD